jgi:hypothetical protein
VGGAEYYKGIDLFVLLLDRGKDQDRQAAAERPACVRDYAPYNRFRQLLAEIYCFEALVDCADAGSVLAGIKLTRYNRFSRLHFRPP